MKISWVNLSYTNLLTPKPSTIRLQVSTSVVCLVLFLPAHLCSTQLRLRFPLDSLAHGWWYDDPHRRIAHGHTDPGASKSKVDCSGRGPIK